APRWRARRAAAIMEPDQIRKGRKDRMQRIQDADILLVDDTPELLALVSRALAGAGYTRLRTAGSCAAARRAFAARVPELVVLDINLPDGDGFSLFRELNAGGEVPVLFLSARDADAD